MNSRKGAAYRALREYFGFDAFRPGQEGLILAILSGRDTLGILPTGGGKSLCYSIPALIFEGTSVIVSPLISLMEDQVAKLRDKGIDAAALHGALPKAEQERILARLSPRSNAVPPEKPPRPSPGHSCTRPEGPCRAAFTLEKPPRLIFVSPERLKSPAFLAAAKSARIPFVCVDEAHCISQWGREFRPSYRQIAAFIDALPVRPVTAAFTASATKEVRGDIVSLLKLRDPYVHIASFDRPNLYFCVYRTSEKRAALLALVLRRRGSCGIIYFRTRKSTERTARLLRRSGIAAACYHGGLGDEERAASQESWIRGDCLLMCATCAFGMGIDKPDVRFVIHYNMPGDMEDYYQEAGRAGRDGKPAECILLYDYRDVVIGRFFIDGGDVPADAAAAKLRRKMLWDMQYYVSGKECLRRLMLRYFGEELKEDCGRCGVCQKKKTRSKSASREGEDPDLFLELRALRLSISKRRRVLPSKIFSDRALHEMAALRPQSLPALLLLEHAGFLKGLRFGLPFAETIRLWEKCSPPEG